MSEIGPYVAIGVVFGMGVLSLVIAFPFIWLIRRDERNARRSEDRDGNRTMAR